MTLEQFKNTTIGWSELGTNPSDKGECLGYISLYFQQVLGLTYPISGATYAYEMLTKPNNHPEILTQVQGTAGMKAGDVWVMGTNIVPVTGHIGIALAVHDGVVDTIEQNWVHHKVTNETHPLNQIKGYIRIGGNMPSAEYNEIMGYLSKDEKTYMLPTLARVEKLEAALNAIVNSEALQDPKIQKAISDSQEALKIAQGASTQATGLTTEEKATVSWGTKLRNLLGIK